MNRILLLETSSRNCSVALGVDGVLQHVVEMDSEEYVHAEKLHVFIQQLLKETNVSLTQLSAICISKGPGSYTGLRIGTSAAKGLCYGLNIPLIAIETTLILASYAKEKFPRNRQFLPMIDARRMEVYCALYDIDLTVMENVDAKIVDEVFFQKHNMEHTVFVGDGVEKCKTLIPYPENMLPCLPSASMMASLAQQKFNQQVFEDVAYFEPYYLKDFIAGVAKKNPFGFS